MVPIRTLEYRLFDWTVRLDGQDFSGLVPALLHFLGLSDCVLFDGIATCELHWFSLLWLELIEERRLLMQLLRIPHLPLLPLWKARHFYGFIAVELAHVRGLPVGLGSGLLVVSCVRRQACFLEPLLDLLDLLQHVCCRDWFELGVRLLIVPDMLTGSDGEISARHFRHATCVQVLTQRVGLRYVLHGPDSCHR